MIVWDYVPIFIGIFGALIVSGIYWKLKNNAVSYFKLLQIALGVAFGLSLFSARYVHFRSAVALIVFWIVEFILYIVIKSWGSQLKKTFEELRLDPQRYLISRALRVNETVKPIKEALVPKGSWKDVRIGKFVSPVPLEIALAIGALIGVLFIIALTWVLFFSEEEYLRLVVWTLRYSLLFSVAIITFCYLMVLVTFAALQRVHIMLFPIRFGKSHQCVADWSGYGAVLASCYVLVLPVFSLFVNKKLNTANHTFFSLSLLFDAASVGSLGGLAFGCFVGLVHLIDSRNILYNSVGPAVFFGLLNLGVLYNASGLRPSTLLNSYLESYSIEGVDACDNAETAKLIFDECLSWKCERFLAVAKKCDSSVNAVVAQNDSIYFWMVMIGLFCAVGWRVMVCFMPTRSGLGEDGDSPT